MITTFDNDGFKFPVWIPIGTSVKTGMAYPVSTMTGKTLTAFIGVIAANGGVSGSVAASTVTFTEAAVTATEAAFWALKGVELPEGQQVAKVTALWTPAAVVYGKDKTAQFVATVPGDKPYTILSQPLQVLASL